MRTVIFLLCLSGAFAQTALAQRINIIDAKTLGRLDQTLRIDGQFYNRERQHFYRFTLAERACIVIGATDVSSTLRIYLRDDGGGQLQDGFLQPQRRERTTGPGGMASAKLFPADYVLHLELFRRNDSAGTYQVVITKMAC